MRQTFKERKEAAEIARLLTRKGLFAYPTQDVDTGKWHINMGDHFASVQECEDAAPFLVRKK